MLEADKETEVWLLLMNSLARLASLLTFLVVLWNQATKIREFLLQYHVTRLALLYSKGATRAQLLAWLQKNLPTHDLALRGEKTLWTNGSLLCILVNIVVPDACLNPFCHQDETPAHGQVLAYKYLGIPPAFTEDELSHLTISTQQEKKLIKYLNKIKSAITSFTITIENMKFSTDYIAKGMGLVTGEQNRKSVFFIYPIPKRYHLEDITVIIKGPYSTYGQIIVPAIYDKRFKNLTEYKRSLYMSTKLNSISPTLHGTGYLRKLSLNYGGGTENDIQIRIKVTKTHAKIMYIPKVSGIHEVSLITSGHQLIGSPYIVTVDAPTNKYMSDYDSLSDDESDTILISKKYIPGIVDVDGEKMYLKSNGRLEKITNKHHKKEDKNNVNNNQTISLNQVNENKKLNTKINSKPHKYEPQTNKDLHNETNKYIIDYLNNCKETEFKSSTENDLDILEYLISPSNLKSENETINENESASNKLEKEDSLIIKEDLINNLCYKNNNMNEINPKKVDTEIISNEEYDVNNLINTNEEILILEKEDTSIIKENLINNLCYTNNNMNEINAKKVDAEITSNEEKSNEEYDVNNLININEEILKLEKEDTSIIKENLINNLCYTNNNMNEINPKKVDAEITSNEEKSNEEYDLISTHEEILNNKNYENNRKEDITTGNTRDEIILINLNHKENMNKDNINDFMQANCNCANDNFDTLIKPIKYNDENESSNEVNANKYNDENIDDQNEVTFINDENTTSLQTPQKTYSSQDNLFPIDHLSQQLISFGDEKITDNQTSIDALYVNNDLEINEDEKNSEISFPETEINIAEYQNSKSPEYKDFETIMKHSNELLSNNDIEVLNFFEDLFKEEESILLEYEITYNNISTEVLEEDSEENRSSIQGEICDKDLSKNLNPNEDNSLNYLESVESSFEEKIYHNEVFEADDNLHYLQKVKSYFEQEINHHEDASIDLLLSEDDNMNYLQKIKSAFQEESHHSEASTPNEEEQKNIFFEEQCYSNDLIFEDFQPNNLNNLHTINSSLEEEGSSNDDDINYSNLSETEDEENNGQNIKLSSTPDILENNMIINMCHSIITPYINTNSPRKVSNPIKTFSKKDPIYSEDFDETFSTKNGLIINKMINIFEDKSNDKIGCPRISSKIEENSPDLLKCHMNCQDHKPKVSQPLEYVSREDKTGHALKNTNKEFDKQINTSQNKHVVQSDCQNLIKLQQTELLRNLTKSYIPRPKSLSVKKISDNRIDIFENTNKANEVIKISEGSGALHDMNIVIKEKIDTIRSKTTHIDKKELTNIPQLEGIVDNNIKRLTSPKEKSKTNTPKELKFLPIEGLVRNKKQLFETDNSKVNTPVQYGSMDSLTIKPDIKEFVPINMDSPNSQDSIKIPSIGERIALLHQSPPPRQKKTNIIANEIALNHNKPLQDMTLKKEAKHEAKEEIIEKVIKEEGNNLTKKRIHRFQKAKHFFKSLEDTKHKVNTEQIFNMCNVHIQKVQRSISFPCLTDDNTNKKHNFNRNILTGSMKSINVLERFYVSNLFHDILGDSNRMLRGIPNRKAVAAALASLDTESSTAQCPSPLHKPAQPSKAQTFQNEYPHLPASSKSSIPRSDTASLIPGRILMAKSDEEIYV